MHAAGVTGDMRYRSEFLTSVAETFWEWQSAVQVVFWPCPVG